MTGFPDSPFAVVKDLEDRWKTLDDNETTTAGVLLSDASRMIINRCADAKHKDAETLKIVVCDVVRRAMAGPLTFGMGVSSVQQGAGPYQQTAQFSNPMGDLYLSKGDLKMLGCGGQKAFTIELGGADVHR